MVTKIRNAVVHTQRGHVIVNAATDAYIKVPGPGNMNAEGMQVSTLVVTDLLTHDGATCEYKAGDVLVIDARTDFPSVGQVAAYVIQKAYASGTGRLALWRVEVTGAIR